MFNYWSWVKKFTNHDLNNSDLYGEIAELISKEYCNNKLLDLVRKGMDIVQDNENFILGLHSGMRYHDVPTIYVDDDRRKETYEIYYNEKDSEDRYYLKIGSTGKQYLFGDLSQIELYFDTRREFSKS